MTGEFAQHLSERNSESPKTHPYLHVTAQKLLQQCNEFEKKGKSYAGILKKNEQKIYIIFFIWINFAIVKTCFINEQ